MRTLSLFDDYNNDMHITNKIMKIKFNRDGKQFHQYQQSEHSQHTLTHWTQKKTTTYDIGNLGPCLGCCHSFLWQYVVLLIGSESVQGFFLSFVYKCIAVDDPDIKRGFGVCPLSFFFCPLYCLPLHVRPLITPLISFNFSVTQIDSRYVELQLHGMQIWECLSVPPLFCFCFLWVSNRQTLIENKNKTTVEPTDTHRKQKQTNGGTDRHS
jgi:hypothetical protein